MENFKEWLNAQEMAFGTVARTAGRVASDLAFGPDTGVDAQQAVNAAGGVATAAQMAAYKAKQFWHQKRCQMRNAQSCMTACSQYHDQWSCDQLMSFKNKQ